MRCPYCDGESCNYKGIEDGGGDYGDSLCDVWECLDCGLEFEDGCVEVVELLEPEDDPELVCAWCGGWLRGDTCPECDSPDEEDTKTETWKPEFPGDIPF